jgi:hypothetical protein
LIVPSASPPSCVTRSAMSSTCSRKFVGDLSKSSWQCVELGPCSRDEEATLPHSARRWGLATRSMARCVHSESPWRFSACGWFRSVVLAKW